MTTTAGGRASRRRAGSLCLCDRSLDRCCSRLGGTISWPNARPAGRAAWRPRKAASFWHRSCRADEARSRVIRRCSRRSESRKRSDAAAVGRACHAARTATSGRTSPAARRYPLVADRPIARAGAWYEMMPRSQSRVPARTARSTTASTALPEIAALGFDVLYLTPIHPIGRTNRKGRNNALRPSPAIPAAPMPSARPEGGHDAVHPELGTLDDFRRLVAACAEHGMEVALDFAVQCSPDHPWLTRASGMVQAPARRLDSIRGESAEEVRGHRQSRFLLRRQRRAVGARCATLCCSGSTQGVRIFRVDNPHTKPFPFWEWLIREVQSRRSRRHLPVRSLHPAEGDEGARQARLQPVLHLFHLAHAARKNCRPI